MNNRERTLAILNYEAYDRMPIVHFGYWAELLQKWQQEGHLTEEQARGWGDGNDIDKQLDKLLGFDFGWGPQFGGNYSLFPAFEFKILEDLGGGMKRYSTHEGLIEEGVPGSATIASTVGTLMTGREAWEELYKPRLQPDPARYGGPANVAASKDYFATGTDRPMGIFAGSLLGHIRNMLGVEGLSYLYADDEELYKEIIDTVGILSYENVKGVLEAGLKVDFLHFWEDICFKNGPLVNPAIFEELIAPHYKRITDLARQHGVRYSSVDCDGLVDKLVPIWLANGVNIMFPIEVGTWEATIAPWREQYGREVRGIGGMNKNVLGADFAAIDQEIERLKPLVDLGGFIPCPDHRIPPDAKWDNVRYYCDRMRKVFA